MKVRYVPTHIGSDGLRRGSRANQGRNHFDTRKDAEAWIAGVSASNQEGLKALVGQGDPKSCRVDAAFCYDHGDALGIYYDETPLMDDWTMGHFVTWLDGNVERREQPKVLYRIMYYLAQTKTPFAKWNWAELRDKAAAAILATGKI